MTVRIKTGCYLELLTQETTKLSKIIKDENGENVLDLEITEVVSVNCNIINNDYQQDSRVLYTSIPNKLFGQLLDISAINFIFLKLLIQNFHTFSTIC